MAGTELGYGSWQDIAPVLSRYSSRIKKGPTLDNAIMAGETTMMAAEVIEALKYVGSSRPYEGTNYCGFIPDKVLRELGIALVDGTTGRRSPRRNDAGSIRPA